MSAHPVDLVASLKTPAHSSSGYRRFVLASAELPLHAQIVEFGKRADLEMAVRPHPEVLGIDFRSESVRRDVPGVPRDRPGFRIDEELSRVAGGAGAVLFNGNNVGYWGNQFVIVNGTPLCKPRGPLFADENLLGELSGQHHIFGWTPRKGFTVAAHKFDAVEVQRDTVGLTAVDPESLPWSGLSGYPVLEGGHQVWHQHICHAWDPRLLFDIGRLTKVTRTELVPEMRSRAKRQETLVRHPLTAVGVRSSGEAVILVVEASYRSRGMTVAEAAAVMQRLGVTDALVLGAAGDAQLATTDEGFLVAPLVADYVQHAARTVSRRHRNPAELGSVPVQARPVPCLVTVRDNASLDRTMVTSPSTGRHSLR